MPRDVTNARKSWPNWHLQIIDLCQLSKHQVTKKARKRWKLSWFATNISAWEKERLCDSLSRSSWSPCWVTRSRFGGSFGPYSSPSYWPRSYPWSSGRIRSRCRCPRPTSNRAEWPRTCRWGRRSTQSPTRSWSCSSTGNSRESGPATPSSSSWDKKLKTGGLLFYLTRLFLAKEMMMAEFDTIPKTPMTAR